MQNSQDARNRALRTWLHGLVAVIGISAYPIVNDWATKGLDQVNWNNSKWMLINSVAAAAVSYIWRTLLDPSRIPSAQPPDDHK